MTTRRGGDLTVGSDELHKEALRFKERNADYLREHLRCKNCLRKYNDNTNVRTTFCKKCQEDAEDDGKKNYYLSTLCPICNESIVYKNIVAHFKTKHKKDLKKNCTERLGSTTTDDVTSDKSEDVESYYSRYNDRHILTRIGTSTAFEVSTDGGSRIWIGKQPTDKQVYSSLLLNGNDEPIGTTLSNGILPVEAVTFVNNELMLLFSKVADDFQQKGITNIEGFRIVISQTMEGLEYLHKLGFSHNNLQPCHVVRTMYGTCKVRLIINSNQ